MLSERFTLLSKLIITMAKKERILPDVLSQDFVITDESVNRYSWRLLVGGIDLAGFLKNPVCCVQHDMEMIPVGKWVNIRVENGKLLGTVEFDPNDDLAIKLYWKYKDGYMNAVSLHVLPIAWDDSDLLPGQKYPTVTQSELLEISLVTVPGQANAVKLSTPEGEEFKLNLLTKSSKQMAKEEKTVEQLQSELEAQRKLNAKNLVAMHKMRGAVVDAEVDSLEKLAFVDYETTEKVLSAREVPAKAEQNTSGEALADALVKLHFDRGAITKDEQVAYKSFALSSYEACKKALEAKPGKDFVQSFVQGINSSSGTPAASDVRSDWDYYRYFKEDPQALSLMEKNEPEKHKKLVADFQASMSNGAII